MVISETSYTFDDVLLVPQFSNILPHETQLISKLTPTIALNIPLLSAAMDTVTEAPMAIAMAEAGGVGIIHKNMSIEAQAAQTKKVKKFESGIVSDPITVSPHTTVGEVKALTAKHNVSGMPVVDENNQVVGIITNRDMRFEQDPQKTVASLMTPKGRLITAPYQADQATIIELFKQHRLEKVILVNERFELCGLVTVKDSTRSTQNPYANKDSQGRLRVGAAIGCGMNDKERALALLEADVDAIVIDTAHGHSQGVIEHIRWLRSKSASVSIIAGNIATADAAIALSNAGADAVKVGMGPGSICTTRIIAGIGVPQISAINHVAKALKDRPTCVIADGGIRFSGDISKALAAGAHTVMLGSLLAGTQQAPGELVLYQGRSYKAYRGMGSIAAMGQTHGSKDRYFQANETNQRKLVPEGVEGMVPFRGDIQQVLDQLMGGLRATLGYCGAATIEDLQKTAVFTRVTPAGMRESHVHDVHITKEAPNYSVKE
jgi:IMP dehydrogenase